jgi:hypothetical protein
MDVKNLVERLGGEEAVRKMAAFQLQNQILVLPLNPPAHGQILIFRAQDSAFAQDFVAKEGLVKLKTLISEATGNTLAYGLTAFAKILQVPDVQAEAFGAVDEWLIDRVKSPFYRKNLADCR